MWRPRTECVQGGAVTSFTDTFRSCLGCGAQRPGIGLRAALSGMAFAFAMPVSVARAQYEEQPLRPNLAPEPCFRTEDGRERKRGADALINRYRLYDFYRRQADQALASPPGPRLLPPYPGLDGGRRGHWGATNERETTALPRKRAAEFPVAFARRTEGEMHVRAGRGGMEGLLTYSLRSPGLHHVRPAAGLSVPAHAFSLGADRFGMDLAVAGDVAWAGTAGEWRRNGQAAAVLSAWHLRGGRVVMEWRLGEGLLLETAGLLADGVGAGARVLHREFEFTAAAAAGLEVHLPTAAGIADVAPWQRDGMPAGGCWLERRIGDVVVLHRVEAMQGLDCAPDEEGRALRLAAVPAGGRLSVTSWAGPAAAAPLVRAGAEAAVRAAFPVAPSALPAGTHQDLGPEVRAVGRLDADPEASGGDYVIDDIPLPGDEAPWAAMTISGIDFAPDGTAWVCTLVGDVWRVTGLHGDLTDVRWKRFAAGLNLPMGLVVVDGLPCVSTVPDIVRLRDVDGDGTADRHEVVNREPIPAAGQCGRDLRLDRAGNFHLNTAAGIWRIPPDGSKTVRIGGGARNPFGIGVRADGLVISDSSEGDNGNGTCTLYESEHPDNASSVAKLRRLLYLPRGIDNSPGSRRFLDEPRFGLLGSSLIGVSYGTGTWYVLLRDVIDGTSQAALVPQPGLFLSGTCRLAVQPRDGQVFVAGLDGWGDYAVAEGCLHRIRWTGRTSTRVVGWRAHRNGLRLDFSAPLAAELPASAAVFVQQWNVIDSAHTYGSMEMSVRQPDMPGHDRLDVRRLVPAADRRSVFLEIPDLLPAAVTQVRMVIPDAAGRRVDVDLYATLQRLAPEPPDTAAAAADAPVNLVIPERPTNGNTYQVTIEHFDRLAGRVPIQRPVTPEVAVAPEAVTYTWLRRHLLEPHCFMCHGAGMPHDFTTWQGLRARVRMDAPERSPLLGMLQTSSMPPYPLPTVSRSMQQAVLEWIRRGAPE